MALLLAFTTKAALVPQGGEYAISGARPGDQTSPALAISPNGGWSVWQENGIDNSGLGIAAGRLDAGLNVVGPVIRMNRTVAGDQEKPAVALRENGGAVAAWQGGRLGFQNIFVRFLNSDGTFATDEILVNEPEFSRKFRVTTNWTVIRNNRLTRRTQRISGSVDVKLERSGGVAVASLADRTVVVAYTSGRSYATNLQTLTHPFRWNGLRFITNSVLKYVNSGANPMQDVYFQLFTADGQKTGPEIRANQYVDFNQRNPALTPLSDGSFLLVWVSEQQGENGSIVARIFNQHGAPVGDEFVVNTSSRPCSEPSVAATPGQGFTIAWTQRDPSTRLDVFARAYSPSAAPITDAFRVNNEVRGEQYAPKVAASAAGQLVVWTSLNQDTSREGVYGRWLNDGTVASDEFRVNTTIYLRQFNPSVAVEGNRALVIWSSYQSGAGFDLFGQRYAP